MRWNDEKRTTLEKEWDDAILMYCRLTNKYKIWEQTFADRGEFGHNTSIDFPNCKSEHTYGKKKWSTYYCDWHHLFSLHTIFFKISLTKFHWNHHYDWSDHLLWFIYDYVDMCWKYFQKLLNRFVFCSHWWEVVHANFHIF